MKILVVIPARYASSRLPAKPLLDIEGKSMIRRVYEQVTQVSKCAAVVVATDNSLIFDHVTQFGGKVAMTDPNHPSGTDRCAEVLQQMGGKTAFDYVINVQGDEPFIAPEMIEELIQLFDGKTEIATAVKQIEEKEQLFNSNVVKAVLSVQQQALYFSRQAIPFVRDVAPENWLETTNFYKHIGIYGFRSDILERIVAIPVSELEATEKLEQLRWLSHGYRIQAVITEHESKGVDTEEDLEVVRALACRTVRRMA